MINQSINHDPQYTFEVHWKIWKKSFSSVFFFQWSINQWFSAMYIWSALKIWKKSFSSVFFFQWSINQSWLTMYIWSALKNLEKIIFKRRNCFLLEKMSCRTYCWWDCSAPCTASPPTRRPSVRWAPPWSCWGSRNPPPAGRKPVRNPWRALADPLAETKNPYKAKSRSWNGIWLRTGAFSWRVEGGKCFLRVFLLCAFCAMRLATGPTQALCFALYKLNEQRLIDSMSIRNHLKISRTNISGQNLIQHRTVVFFGGNRRPVRDSSVSGPSLERRRPKRTMHPVKHGTI